MSIRTTIGDHAVYFNRKSEFIYKAVTHIDSYSIKKIKVREIFAQFPEMG